MTQETEEETLSFPCVCVSHVQLCNPTDWSPPGSSPHGILQQEYWSGLPLPSPDELPSPGIEPWSPASQVDSLPFESQGSLTFS